MVEASKISKSITPTSDVYITCGKKVIDPRAPLCAQGVVEASVLRIHYRLRGGAPGGGQPGSRCHFYHEQRGSSCTICGSDDHSWEQCMSYGGGQYDANKDPRVLAAAEKRKQLEPNGSKSLSGLPVSALSQLSRPTLHLVSCGVKSQWATRKMEGQQCLVSRRRRVVG